MRAKIEDNKLRIDLYDLVDSMSPEDRMGFVRYAGFDRQIFEGLLSVLTSRHGHLWTDIVDECWAWNLDTADRWREELLPLLPEATRHLVAGLIRRTEQAELNAKRWERWAWSLFHEWPKDPYVRRPDTPDFVQPGWDQYPEADRLLSEAESEADR